MAKFAVPMTGEVIDLKGRFIMEWQNFKNEYHLGYKCSKAS